MNARFFFNLLLSACALFFTNALIAQCDTEFDLEQKAYFDNLIESLENRGDRSQTVDVPVAFHIMTVNGNPQYNAANLVGVIAQCNQWYADGNFSISQCGSPFYYAQGTNSPAINHVINVYITTSYTGCGVYFGLIQINPNCSLPMDEILAHEIGHALGLPHTHGYTNYGTTTELANGSNCTTHGDQFCDTPADPNILGLVNGSCNYVGTLTDANGDFYTPDTGNIMSYTNGNCRTHFSTEQLERMYDVAVANNYYCCLTPVPAVQNLTTCLNTSLLINVNSPVPTIFWYEQPTGGLPIHEGQSYQTPVLSQSTNLYAEAYDGCSSDRAKITIEVLPGLGILDNIPQQISSFEGIGGEGGQGGQGVSGLEGSISNKIHTDTLDYFIVGGTQLWSFDGEILNHIYTFNIAGGTNVASFSDTGEKLLIAINDWNANQALYSSDGTTDGTVEVKSWPAATYDYSNFWLTSFGSQTLFMLTTSSSTAELWKTDGTGPGTVLVKGLSPTSGYNDFGMTAFNGHVYFAASASGNNNELWRTDGTTAGTALFAEINPTAGSSPDLLGSFGGELYFSANDGTNGQELWKTDGINAPNLVADINAAGSSNIYLHFIFEDHMIFGANDGFSGTELWKTDGTAMGTELLADLNPGGSSYPGRFCESNGKVYFGAGIVNGEHQALFVYDPILSEVQLVKRFGQTGYGGVDELFSLNNLLYFRAANTGNNYELWASDGMSSGTKMLVEINPSAIQGSSPSSLFSRNNKLFFMANNGTTGQQLWSFSKENLTFCAGQEAVIQTGNTSGVVNWFDDPAGNSLVHTGFAYTIPNAQGMQSIWASLTISGCESALTDFSVDVFKIDSLQVEEFVCEGSATDLLVYVNGSSPAVWFDLNSGTPQTSASFMDIAPGSYDLHVNFDGICALDTAFNVVGLPVLSWYLDNDLDGYGAILPPQLSCFPVYGHVNAPGDCNDNNPGIHPGAPGNSNGIDTNCNGVIDPGEAFCQGDFNGDGFVNTSDLFIFLGNYGCTASCPVDLNADGIVNASDLFILLSLYGIVCP